MEIINLIITSILTLAGSGFLSIFLFFKFSKKNAENESKRIEHEAVQAQIVNAESVTKVYDPIISQLQKKIDDLENKHNILVKKLELKDMAIEKAFSCNSFPICPVLKSNSDIKNKI